MIFFAACFDCSNETADGTFEEAGDDNADGTDDDAAELTGELAFAEEMTAFGCTFLPDIFEPQYEAKMATMAAAQSKKVNS